MNYYIDIIDTDDNSHITIEELAAAESIVLSYSGSDEKDFLSVVGTSLRFNMLVESVNNIDGKYLHLFTGDEQRYKVVIYRESDDFKIWQGFVLPDSYSEPWQTGSFFVDFEAVDGLGRLKGKYLSDQYYQNEYSVIEYVAECLKLTGLELPIYFSPGVDNSTVKTWHTIYIDGLNFVKSNKNLDAYSILETICNDTVSCLFQSLGFWYVIGLNKRNLVTYKAKHYTFEGVYVEDLTLNRNKKEIQHPVASPLVTMVPPYNIITVEHEREPVALPKTIATESNEGWAVVTGVIGEVYATDWVGNGGCYVKSKHSNYKNTIKSIGYQAGSVFYSVDYAFDNTKFVNLNNKLYLKAGQKVGFNFEFELLLQFNIDTDAEIESIRNQGYWTNPFIYEITLNGNIIFTNDDLRLSFNKERIGVINIDYVAPESGVLDVKIYQPSGRFNNHYIEFVQFNTIEVKDLDFIDNYTAIQTISNDYSIDKDVTLTFADDASGSSKAFLLQKLRNPEENYDSIDVPILYADSYLGKFYSVVQLDGANLIKDNINTVYYGATLLTDLDVIYNYQGGEQMVVITPQAYTTGNFTVRVYNTNNYTGSRANWETWTDSVYEIESLRFADVVANIYRRMFAVPHQKVDLEVQFPVSFNDILVWSYIEQSNYYVINTSWNLDTGFSTVTMVKAVYQNDDTISPTENIPPIVDAGPDIYIQQNVNHVDLFADAFDPDGFIVSYLWEQLEGANQSSVINPIDASTNIQNLTADFYKFKITVADNDGATAFDEVSVFRVNDYTVELVLIDSSATIETYLKEEFETYQIVVTPELPAGFTIQINLEYRLTTSNNDAGILISEAEASIVKGVGVNEVVLETNEVNDIANTLYETNLNYNPGTIIKCLSRVRVENTDPPFSVPSPQASAQASFFISSVSFINGFGNVINVPNSKSNTVSF